MICCPVCCAPMERSERLWRCPAGHSFDIARQGYVNLLPADHKHSRSPGDSPMALQARRRFLDGGFYAPLAERLGALLADVGAGTVLDIGCGEGYYLRQLGRMLPQARRVGVDISKDAVRLAAGRDKDALWLCASASALPIASGSCRAAMGVFAYLFPGQCARVLEPGGRLIEVTAGPEHLLALREVIYPSVRRREKPPRAYEGFVLEGSERLQIPLVLQGREQIADLLAMTPHFWRISQQGAARAAALDRLEDMAQMQIHIYRKETAYG